MSAFRSWPAALCWLVVLLDGFDLVVLGVVIPTLIDQHHLGFTASSTTVAATLSLVGVAIGAALSGPVADRVGRRRALLAAVALFSVATIALPLSPSIEVFDAWRLIGGIGLGACMPVALTLMSEYSDTTRKATASTLTMTGYHTGAVIAALVGLAFLPSWTAVFYVGGVAGLLLLPMLWFKLPESEAFLAARADATRPSIRTLFAGHLARTTIGIWIGSFMGLLLVYGLNTWLPKLMHDAGYSLATSLSLLLMLNIGAIAGLVLAGAVADRRGTKSTILLWFGASAVLLALLSVRIDSSVLLNGLVFVTGMFVFSAQVLVYAYVTQAYPAPVRGTALGLAASVGRLGAIFGPTLTGALIASGQGHPWGFYLFALVAALAVIALAVIPRAGTAAPSAREDGAVQLAAGNAA